MKDLKKRQPKTLAKVLEETASKRQICGKHSGKRQMCKRCEEKVNRVVESLEVA